MASGNCLTNPDICEDLIVWQTVVHAFKVLKCQQELRKDPDLLWVRLRLLGLALKDLRADLIFIVWDSGPFFMRPMFVGIMSHTLLIWHCFKYTSKQDLLWSFWVILPSAGRTGAPHCLDLLTNNGRGHTDPAPLVYGISRPYYTDPSNIWINRFPHLPLNRPLAAEGGPADRLVTQLTPGHHVARGAGTLHSTST